MRIAFMAVLISAVITLGFSANAAQDAKADVVIALENELGKSCVAGDVKPFEKVLSEQFRAVNADGSVEQKGKYIDGLRDGNLKCTEYKLSDVGCQVLGEVVIFHAVVSQKATFKKKDCSGEYQLTDVWVKEGGEWRCVCSQWTSVAK